MKAKVVLGLITLTLVGSAQAYDILDKNYVKAYKINGVDQFTWARNPKRYPSKLAQVDPSQVNSDAFPPAGAFAIQARVLFPSLTNTIARMQFRTVVDPKGARVKSDLTRNIFATGVYTEEEITVLEPEKQRMLVANSKKNMCMRYDLKDITPISLSHAAANTQNDEVVDQAGRDNRFQKVINGLKHRLEYLGLHSLSQERTEKAISPEGYPSYTVHIFKDVDSVPLFNPSYYLGVEKESGLETYYYFNSIDFRLIGGMHLAHDVR